jgi:hypothetical protein
MVRRAILDSGHTFRTDLRLCEDYEFWLRLANIHNFAFTPIPLVTRRLHGSNLIDQRIALKEAAAAVLEEYEWYTPAVRRLTSLRYDLGSHHLRERRWSDAARYLEKCQATHLPLLKKAVWGAKLLLVDTLAVFWRQHGAGVEAHQ